MAVTLQILDAEDGLAGHQTALRRAEKRGFTLLSLSAGRADGLRANLVLLEQSPPPDAPITLRSVDGGLDKDPQEQRLNEIDGPIVAYGGFYVSGKLINVVAHR